MTKIKRIGVLSLAKLQAGIMAFSGLIIGAFYAIIGAVFGVVGDSFGIGTGLGLLAIVVFPILYAILGFISGALIAFVYNLIAGRVGGVEVELEQGMKQSRVSQ